MEWESVGLIICGILLIGIMAWGAIESNKADKETIILCKENCKIKEMDYFEKFGSYGRNRWNCFCQTTEGLIVEGWGK